MKVWIHSNQKVFEQGLLLLLASLGIEASSIQDSLVDTALWDLTCFKPPYPVPPALPTLAILSEASGVVDVLRQRYRGYIRQGDDSAVLKQALQAVHRGEIWAERHVLTAMVDSVTTPKLTSQEQRTLNLLADGKSNREIAHALGVVEGTVKMHVSHLFEKLGVKNRSELLALLLHNQSIHKDVTKPT